MKSLTLEIPHLDLSSRAAMKTKHSCECFELFHAIEKPRPCDAATATSPQTHAIPLLPQKMARVKLQARQTAHRHKDLVSETG
jgi:hypothetical protein